MTRNIDSHEFTENIRIFLIKDLKAFAMCYYLKDFKKSNPIDVNRVTSDFGPASEKILKELFSVGCIEKKSAKSPMIYLTELGVEAIHGLNDWINELKAKLLEKATTSVATNPPLQLSNLRVISFGDVDNHELMLNNDNAQPSSIPKYLIEKDISESSPLRFYNLMENQIDIPRTVAYDGLKIPSSTEIEQIKQMAEKMLAEPERKNFWQK